MSLTPPGEARGNLLKFAKDRIFAVLFVIAVIVGVGFSLGSVGYLLGFNATTLVLITAVFSTMSYNYWLSDKHSLNTIEPVEIQMQGTALAVIPIGLRWALQMPFFQYLVASYGAADPFTQTRHMVQVLGLWVLVAVSEEAFRAAMMNFAELFATFRDKGVHIAYKAVFANVVWVAFHFFQRPFDVTLYGPYVVWLFASGLVMTYALVKYGLGSATLIHLIVNLTA